MADWLRRAGHLRLDDGRTLTWTVAEGRRGRRWREAVTDPGGPGIRHSLLLETDSAGWFSHLELATDAGLLTLHREGDGTLHGNTVTRRGVDHVRGLAWDPQGVVLVDGSIVSRLAAFLGLATVVEVGATREILTLRIAQDLRLLTDREPIAHGPAHSWSIGDAEHLLVDGDGLLPPSRGTTWPLEASG